MKELETLSSIEGRKVLRDIFKELRFVRQRNSLSSILICWRISCFEKQLNKYIGEDISIRMPLGLFRGTGLWMSEIVNRNYYSTINSFVYLGAAILLILIGARRFSEAVKPELVIAGIIFESLMLTIMFIVMFFTPNEASEEEETETDFIIDEIGEIGRDFASAVIHLENLTKSLNKMVDTQNELSIKIYEQAKSFALLSKPNPGLTEEMKSTTKSLSELKESIIELKAVVREITTEQIRNQVRIELQELLSTKINYNEAK